MSTDLKVITTHVGTFCFSEEELKRMLLQSDEIFYNEETGVFGTTANLHLHIKANDYRNPLGGEITRAALHKYMFGKLTDPSIRFYYILDPLIVGDNARSVMLRSHNAHKYAIPLSGSFAGRPLGSIDINYQGDSFTAESLFVPLLLGGLIAVSSDGQFLGMKFIDCDYLQILHEANILQRNVENLLKNEVSSADKATVEELVRMKAPVFSAEDAIEQANRGIRDFANICENAKHARKNNSLVY